MGPHIFPAMLVSKACIDTMGARGGQPSWKGKEFILGHHYDVYRVENRKMEVCRVSCGAWGDPWAGSVKFHK